MSSARSAFGMPAERALLDAHLGVDLLVGRRDRGVLAQRHRERAGEQAGDAADARRCARSAPRRHAGDQRGVADQSVHRAECRRAQPAAGHVAVRVIELMRQPGASVGCRPSDSSYTRFNAWSFARSSQVCLRLPHHSFRGRGDGLPSGMTTTAEHLRNTLDGRWRDVKNRMRRELSSEIFRPHYTPNTVIARTKVARAAEDHGGRTARPRTGSRRSTAATATSARRSPRSRCWRCPTCR